MGGKGSIGKARGGSRPAAVCDRQATPPAGPSLPNPSGGGSFRLGLRWFGRNRPQEVRPAAHRLAQPRIPQPQNPSPFSDRLLAQGGTPFIDPRAWARSTELLRGIDRTKPVRSLLGTSSLKNSGSADVSGSDLDHVRGTRLQGFRGRLGGRLQSFRRLTIKKTPRGSPFALLFQTPNHPPMGRRFLGWHFGDHQGTQLVVLIQPHHHGQRSPGVGLTQRAKGNTHLNSFVAEPVGQAIHRYRNGGDQQQDDSQGFAIHGGTGRSPPPGAFEGISGLEKSCKSKLPTRMDRRPRTVFESALAHEP